jgi:hypothetical protein
MRNNHKLYKGKPCEVTTMGFIQKEDRPVLIFSIAWLAVNLIQAGFTELIDDEAYYWMYSRYLDWGYYDHPPMIAVLIKLGYSIFPNELGVRLLPGIMGSLTLFFIYKLIDSENKNPFLYMLTVSAIILMHFHVSGFTAIPDLPLVFFASLFLLIYKSYLKHDSLLYALLLSIAIAGMLYSKYHSLFLILLTLLANPRILYRRSFYVIFMLSVVLFLPHLYWQYKHGFISVQYHLVSRNDPFEWKHIYEYFYNQVIITGPFIGVILLYLSFSYKVGNDFERVLKYILVGFFGLFLLSAFKDHVEPHWTAIGFIPMIVLSHRKIVNRPKIRRWIIYLSLLTIPIILFIRIWLITEFVTINDHTSRLFHDKDKLMEEISSLAGDRPVVFTNKYQRPSLYTFYTGKFATTRTAYYYRKNQFDLWNFEHSLADTPVFYLPPRPYPGTRVLEAYKHKLYYDYLPGLCSYSRIAIELNQNDLVLKPGEEVILPVELYNGTSVPISFQNACDLDISLFYIFIDKENNFEVSRSDTILLPGIDPGQTISTSIKVVTPTEPGNYDLIISTGSDVFIPGRNSKFYKIKICN